MRSQLLAACAALSFFASAQAPAQTFTIYRGPFDPTDPKGNLDIVQLAFSLNGLTPTPTTGGFSYSTTATAGTPLASLAFPATISFSDNEFDVNDEVFRGFQFGGTASAPTFTPGTYNLKDFGFAGEATLILQADPDASAVPEPATWGMMILGLGAMGFAMRRRAKVRTNVSFA